MKQRPSATASQRLPPFSSHIDSQSVAAIDSQSAAAIDSQSEAAIDSQSAAMARTNDQSDSSGDDAPDDVGFTQSKESALDQLKSVTEAAKKLRDEERKSRRKRQETLREQKEKKRIRLEEIRKKKIDVSILEALADPKQLAKAAEEKSKGASKIKKLDVDEDHSEGASDDAQSADEDFIPLVAAGGGGGGGGRTRFQVSSRADRLKQKSASADAMQFKRSKFFGAGSSFVREPVKTALARRDNLRRSGAQTFCIDGVRQSLQ